MQNYCKTIGALAAASALVAGNASAEIEGEIHAGYTSEYIFRGVNQGNDLIEAGADIAYEVAGFGLSAGAWYGSFEAPVGGNFDTDADELDLYGEVSKDLGFATVAVGFIYYYYPEGDVNELGGFYNPENTSEAYVSISRDFGFLEAGLTYFHDVKGDNDGYTELALSKSFELSQCLALNVGGNLGYLAEEGHLAHFTTKVSLDWGFAGTAKISPFAAHSLDLSGGHGIAYGNAKNEFVGGAILSVGF